MGNAPHTVVRAGQTIEVGVAIDQDCDENGCTEQIVRTWDHLCGEDHGDNESGCGRYFCSRHLYIDGDAFETEEPLLQLCAACSEDPQPAVADTGTEQDGDLVPALDTGPGGELTTEVTLTYQPADVRTPYRSVRSFTDADLVRLLLAWDDGSEA
jgi:hypothetical protein